MAVILICLILLVGFVIAKIPVWTGIAPSGEYAGNDAAGECEGYTPTQHRFDVFEAASIHFDHPLQRLLTFSMDTYGYDNKTHTMRVAGYSFFGIKITEAIYDCRGGLTTTKNFFF